MKFDKLLLKPYLFFNGLLLTISAILFPLYVSNPEMTSKNAKILVENMKAGFTSPIIHIFGYLAMAWGLYLVYCAVCSIEKDKKKAYLTVGASVCIITMDLKFLTPALMN